MADWGVDYRGINKKTIPDCYPIPRIDDLIDTVGRCGGKIFTTLDLMKGRKCESCVDCASVQGQGVKGTPPLVSIPIGGPFECIGMDFVELDKSTDGNCYALVFQDYLTKWPEVYAVNNRRATTVAGCLLDLIWRHGAP